MQSTMIMSALANDTLGKASEMLNNGEMVETSASQLENIVGANDIPVQYLTRPKVKQLKRANKKIGRNDPCPCGATDENGKPKKYKKCCLKTGEYEGYVEV